MLRITSTVVYNASHFCRICLVVLNHLSVCCTVICALDKYMHPDMIWDKLYRKLQRPTVGIYLDWVVQIGLAWEIYSSG